MMDWSNERFIKVYTRDTADWMTLSFDAQALFMLILRKLDRSGRIDLGKQGRKAIAVAIGHGSLWPRLEPALQELIDDGCVEIGSNRLIVPNFELAQEARKSNAQRQRDFKERKRSAGIPEVLGNVSSPEHNETLPGNITLPTVDKTLLSNAALLSNNESLPKGNAEKREVTTGNSSDQNRLEQSGEGARVRDPSTPCVAVPAQEPAPLPPQSPPALPEPATPSARPIAALPVPVCSTVEHAHAFDPTEALYAMRQGSDGSPRGQLGRMASAHQLVALAEIASTATPRPLTCEDFRVLGQAWKAGKALGWRDKAPDLGWLLRDGGQHLMAGVEEALAWKESQQHRAPVVRIVPTVSTGPIFTPQELAERARVARAQLASLKAGRANGC